MHTVADHTVVVWECDHENCNEQAITIFESIPMKQQVPKDWSGVLVTSMSDGDYMALFCPLHSERLKSSINTLGTSNNIQIVGF
jgi:hypothetical protein